MSDDLVKRLREKAFRTETYELVNEAADRIEQDAQHIDEMYELVTAMNTDHTASKTRIEKLEAALRAVVRYAGNAGDDYLADQARKALEGKDG
jgi:methylphosphotriester-DNA--protein-cysteine methyltransferase